MAEENEVQEQPKKKGGMLKWIIISVVVLGIGAAVFLFKDKLPFIGGDEVTEEEVADEKPMAPAPGFQGEMATIDAFVANLNDPLGKRYIKLGLEVELIDKPSVEEFDGAQIKIKNMLLILLGSKQPQEMLGPKNQLKLQQEIVDRINQIIGDGKVLQVYFSMYILQ